MARSVGTVQALVPDVILSILDLCKDDKSTLRSCSLISNAWRPLAQRYILTTIFIYINVPPRTPTDFHSFLTSCPHHSHYIRDVYVSCSPDDRYHPKDVMLNPRDLVPSLSKLSRLRVLRIKNATIQSGPQYEESIPPSIEVDSLQLSRMHLHLTSRLAFQCQPLQSFLSTFAFIGTLLFDDLTCKYPTQSQDSSKSPSKLTGLSESMASSSPPVRVHTLRVADVDALPVFSQYISTAEVQVLQFVDYEYLYERGHQQYQDCLDLMPRLRELAVHIPHTSFPILSLHKCEALDTLRLRIRINKPNFAQKDLAWRFVANMLESLPNRDSLRHLYITSPLEIPRLVCAILNPLDYIGYQLSYSDHDSEVVEAFGGGAPSEWDIFIRVLREFKNLAVVQLHLLPDTRWDQYGELGKLKLNITEDNFAWVVKRLFEKSPVDLFPDDCSYKGMITFSHG